MFVLLLNYISEIPKPSALSSAWPFENLLKGLQIDNPCKTLRGCYLTSSFMFFSVKHDWPVKLVFWMRILGEYRCCSLLSTDSCTTAPFWTARRTTGILPWTQTCEACIWCARLSCLRWRLPSCRNTYSFSLRREKRWCSRTRGDICFYFALILVPPGLAVLLWACGMKGGDCPNTNPALATN